jgi:putative DNA primase/helicase
MFTRKIDSDPFIIGVKNGILDLDIGSVNPQPKLYMQYSPYIVTKCINAEYVPYCENNPYVQIWERIYRETIREDDAREKIQYFNSTALDNGTKLMQMMQEIGCGANGKSVINDNILLLIRNYGKKVASSLLSDKPRGGTADPDLMVLKGSRFALLAETSRGDILNAARIKLVTEKIKQGRVLFGNPEEFECNVTFKMNTNYALTIKDSDDGTWRRMLIYKYKNRFLTEPDPCAQNEYLANTEYSDFVQKNPDAANALLSCLVKWRIDFARKYDSNFEKVPSETIARETAEYRKDQNVLHEFLCSHIVNLIGYNDNGKITNGLTKEEILQKYYFDEIIDDKIMLSKIATEYTHWISVRYGRTKITICDAEKEIKNSRFAKYICENADKKEFVVGKRFIDDNSLARKPEEPFLEI